MASGGADWQTGYRHGLQGKSSQPPTSVKMIEDYSDGYAVGAKEKKDREGFKNSTPFQNGRLKAQQEIQNRVGGVMNTSSKVDIGGGYSVTVVDNGEDVTWKAHRNGQIQAEGDAKDYNAAIREAKAQLIG